MMVMGQKKRTALVESIRTYGDFQAIWQKILAESEDKTKKRFARAIDPGRLVLANDSGWTIAHELALHHALDISAVPDDIVFLRDRDGRTVLHIFAASPKRAFSCPERFLTPEILKMRDGAGNTIAHSFASSGVLPKRIKPTMELLALANNIGDTVAHEIARQGNFPMEILGSPGGEALLLLKRKRTLNGNYTVAHILAEKRTLPAQHLTKKILMSEDSSGWTVAHIWVQKQPLPEHFVADDILFKEDEEHHRTVLETSLANGTFPLRHLTPDKALYISKDRLDHGREELSMAEVFFKALTWVSYRNTYDEHLDRLPSDTLRILIKMLEVRADPEETVRRQRLADLPPEIPRFLVTRDIHKPLGKREQWIFDSLQILLADRIDREAGEELSSGAGIADTNACESLYSVAR